MYPTKEADDTMDASRPHHPTSMVDACGQLCSRQWRFLIAVLGGVWFGLAFLYYGEIIAVSLVFSDEEETTNEDGDEQDSYDFDYSAIFISSSAEILGLIMVLFTVDRFSIWSDSYSSLRVPGGRTLLFVPGVGRFLCLQSTKLVDCLCICHATGHDGSFLYHMGIDIRSLTY